MSGWQSAPLVDATVSADPPASINASGGVQVDIGQDPRNKDPVFAAGLNKLLDDPSVTKEQILEYWNSYVPPAAAGASPAVSPTPAPATPTPQAGAEAQPAWMQAPEIHDPSILRELGIMGRGAVQGIADFSGVVSGLTMPGLTQIESAAGVPSASEQAADMANKVGLPTPESFGERLLEKGTGGAIVGAATMGAGTGASLATSLASGAGGALAGEATKEAGGGPVAQIAASILGGGIAGAASSGAATATRRVASSTEPSDLLAAFQRQQVPPMADAVGGTASRVVSAGAKATLGGIPLAKAAEKAILALRDARDRIAQRMGIVADDTGTGQAIQRGANAFMNGASEKATKLYDAIPIAAEKAATLSNTKQALAEINEGLKSNEELSKLLADPRLKAYESAIAGRTEDVPTGLLDANGKAMTRTVQRGGALSWADLKRFRTFIGEKAGAPAMQADISKKALKRLYAALSEDMRATATAESPKALHAFQRANRYYAAKEARIDRVLTAIFGKSLDKSPEAAFQQVLRWSREGGDAARIAQMMRSLPPEEASIVRASIFSKMGMAKPGNQDISGEVFSPAEFATQWAKLDHRAKSVLFPGADYRQDLDDIARIADSMKRSHEFANTSRTALASRVSGNLVGVAALGWLTHPTVGPVGEIGAYGIGHLLASPRFARWLASAPKKPVGAATLSHINRLSTIAAAEPAIAGSVMDLQHRLTEAFLRSPPDRIAAHEDDQNVRNKPIGQKKANPK
jgi:hypothetical protein